VEGVIIDELAQPLMHELLDGGRVVGRRQQLIDAEVTKDRDLLGA
jgi:hypothetical protein